MMRPGESGRRRPRVAGMRRTPARAPTEPGAAGGPARPPRRRISSGNNRPDSVVGLLADVLKSKPEQAKQFKETIIQPLLVVVIALAAVVVSAAVIVVMLTKGIQLDLGPVGSVNTLTVVLGGTTLTLLVGGWARRLRKLSAAASAAQQDPAEDASEADRP